MTPVHGIVLAGGKSSRFGTDKALAQFEGMPLIAHAVELVRSVGLEVSVITSPGRDYSFLKCPVYFDREPFLGPLSGLDRAFELYSGARLLALTCDMPFLKKEDLLRLLAEDGANSDAVLYRLGPDRFQPFPGIYAASLKDKIDLRGQVMRSMQFFIRKIHKVIEIDNSESRIDFRNVNKIEHLSPI